MKHLKKAASLLLVLVLALSLTVPAWATEQTDTHTAKVSIAEKVDGHQFTAYQIFSGNEFDGKLSNVDWAAGFDGATFLANLIAANIEGTDFESCETAADVAEELAKVTATGAIQVARIAYDSLAKDADGKITQEGTTVTKNSTVMAQGYYLIVDTTAGEKVGEGEVYNASLLQLVGDVTIQAKTDSPTVEKKVKDMNDTESSVDFEAENWWTDRGFETDWQDSADYDIGDKVPFQLKATIPGIAQYETYKVVFNDTLSAGLTLDKTSVVVMINNEIVTTKFDLEMDDHKLTVSSNNVKAEGLLGDAGGEIFVYYTATLNSEAVTGSAGNDNDVTLTYSNNPDTTGEGTTVKDTVTIFTFEVILDKVDGSGNPLQGADFTLMKKENGQWVSKDVLKGNVDETSTKFTFKGLDAGEYYITETKTPNGYNSIQDIYFTIVATHEDEATDPQLTSLVVTNIQDKAGKNLGPVVDVNGTVTDPGKVSFTPNVGEGSLSTQIENNSGAVLPETGGIGTTIFYTVGGILVVGAAILLVTKKRMHNN